jgi:MarR family transcriptional regulator, organic hydroperoxide resistance regulator
MAAENPREALRAAPPSLGEELDFLRLIWAVDHALQSTSKRMERTQGVTGPQRLVLRLLARFPGLTMARLATILRVHASTAGGIVKRLERRGLVERREDARDRRRTCLDLSEAGRAFDDECGGLIETAVRRTLEALPAQAVDDARATLIRLTSELGHGAHRLPGPHVPRALARPGMTVAGPRRHATRVR